MMTSIEPRPFLITSDTEALQNALDSVEAFGGGDAQEDLQAALEVAMKQVDWRQETTKIAFAIAAAAPLPDLSL